MTHLSLFSGIGGLDLAAEWAGFETVGQCEFADYPHAVLMKHWPDVPKWRDIRTLTGESFYERTGLHTVDIISGGFPCQPFSVAGKQRGKKDERYLWPEMLRVIKEIKPRWVAGENVPGIINIAADNVCADLERAGYETWIFNFEAAAVGAPHRRDRIAFVAHANEQGSQGRDSRGVQKRSGKWFAGTSGASVAYTENAERKRNRSKQNRMPRGFTNASWWETEPNVGRVVDGVSNRVDRIKCLGNAVVPQQFYPIFKAIMEVEEATNDPQTD